MRRPSIIESPQTTGILAGIYRITTVLTGMTPGQVYKELNAPGINSMPVLALFMWISGKLRGMFSEAANFSTVFHQSVQGFLDGTSSHPEVANVVTESGRISWLAQNLGLQVFQRVGDDGLTITWDTLGRVQTEPTGGLEPYAEVLDNKDASRKSVSSLIDLILDADYDDQAKILVDPSTASNPLGRVLVWTAATATINTFISDSGFMGSVEDHTSQLIANTDTSWEIGPVPVSGASTDPRNFQ